MATWKIRSERKHLPSGLVSRARLELDTEAIETVSAPQGLRRRSALLQNARHRELAASQLRQLCELDYTGADESKIIDVARVQTPAE